MEIQELRCHNLSITLLECRMSCSVITQLVEIYSLTVFYSMQISVHIQHTQKKNASINSSTHMYEFSQLKSEQHKLNTRNLFFLQKIKYVGDKIPRYLNDSTKKRNRKYLNKLFFTTNAFCCIMKMSSQGYWG